MITLDNISAKLVIPYYADDIKVLVKEKGAKSVGDLLKLMQTYKEYDWIEVRKKLAKVKKRIELSNKRGYEPKPYFTKGYENNALAIQDEMNYGDILLLNTPTEHTFRFSSLWNRTISEIKGDLSHTSENGVAFIAASNSNYRKIGSSNIPRIVTALEMYEQQIERQSQLTSDNNTNLFTMDQRERLDIAQAMYNEIIMYLINNAEERLAWGVLSDYQKSLYISSSINKKATDRSTKYNIANYVANYTTLPELEEVANHNLRVLNRFIVK